MAENKEIIKKTGEFLLTGWKMLNISCPICKTVLLEKNNEKFCIKCNLKVFYENEIISNSLPATATATATTATTQITSLISSPQATSQQLPPQQEQENKNNLKFESLEEVKKIYDKNKLKENLVSIKIGEKLLLGWTLLGESCEHCNTPLMSLKNIKNCVLCEINSDGKISNENLKKEKKEEKEEKKSEIKEEKEVKLNASEQLLSNIPMLSNDDDNDNDDIPLEISAESYELIEEASQLIGEKLLLGWTLLEDVCEGACDGNVPLMKDPKKKQKYCVMCGYVPLPDDNTSIPSTNTPAPSNSNSISNKNQTNVVKQTKKVKIEDEDEVEVEDDFEDEEIISSYTNKRLQEINSHKVSTSHSIPPPLIPEEGSLDEVDQYVLQILNKKLSHTAQQLEQETNVEMSLQLSNLVKSLAEGKREVKKLLNGT